MTKTRRQFTQEFKNEAVALVNDHGYSIAEAASSLDINQNNLRRWIKDIEMESTGERLKTDEREELIRLRRENKQLKMEKEILKKASAFFAKEVL